MYTARCEKHNLEYEVDAGNCPMCIKEKRADAAQPQPGFGPLGTACERHSFVSERGDPCPQCLKLAEAMARPNLLETAVRPSAKTTFTHKPSLALSVQVGGGHYKNKKIQPVEYVSANNLNFLEGCVVKRITRWRDKNGFEDLEKIKHEIDLLIEMEKRYGGK